MLVFWFSGLAHSHHTSRLQIARRLNDGTKALDETDKAFSRILVPFEDFLAVVRRLTSSLMSSISFLTAFIEFVTRTLFCSYQKNLTEFFQRANEWIRSLLSEVGKAVGFIKDLKRHLSVLNVFKGLMNNGIFKVLKEFRSILSGVSKFADSLSFISKLVSRKYFHLYNHAIIHYSSLLILPTPIYSSYRLSLKSATLCQNSAGRKSIWASSR